MIHCVKLNKKAEGLEQAPFPGKVGQQIFETISKQAWHEWISMQTMLINEHRLASYEPKTRTFLASEREKFLFSGDFEMPEGYVAPNSSSENG